MAMLLETLGNLVRTNWKHRDVAKRHSRTFLCRCGNHIFFRNSLCLGCQAPLGYLPGEARLVPLDPGPQPGTWTDKWRAQRYGIHGTFLDGARPQEVPFGRWLDQVVEEAAPDATALGCLDQVMRCCAIATDGTSADAQLSVYRQACDEGAERKEALGAVSEWLAQTTLGQETLRRHRRPRPDINWVLHNNNPIELPVLELRQ
jgi:zinc-ribbon domain